MSVTHIWWGPAAVKSCCRQLGATGRRCVDGVVALKRRAARARSPMARIRLATRRRLTRQSSACKFSVRCAVTAPGRFRGLPPGVIATPTHPEQPTQGRHRKHLFMGLDEGVPDWDSLAKLGLSIDEGYAAAFFRIAPAPSAVDTA